jgi:hypothetical protein
MLYGSDVLTVFYYSRGFLGQELAAGRLGLWDPHTLCGFPLQAGMQAAVFYPPTWLVAILSPGAFWTFTVWLHLVLAGLFAYLWMRRGLRVGPWGSLVSGLVFMLASPMVTHVYAGHISYVSCYPWLAAILWRLERLGAGFTVRRWTLLAAAMAMLVVAGFPQFVLFAWIAVGCRLAFDLAGRKGSLRERARRVAVALGAAALGMVLAAPQLLPTMELVPRIQRTEIGSYDFATQYSMPPENLLLLGVPTLFGDSCSPGVQYWGRWYLWEVSGYAGIAPLLLAVMGVGGDHRQRRLWLGVALGALGVALGRYFPLHRILYEVVPGISLFRAPGRYLYLVTLAMTALAGLGFDRLLLNSPEARRGALRAGVTGGFLLGAMALALALVWSQSRIWKSSVAALDDARGGIAIVEKIDRTPGFLERRQSGAVRSLCWSALVSAAVAGVLALRGCGKFGPRAGLALAALVAIDLLAFSSRYFIGHSLEWMSWPAEFVRQLKERSDDPYRVVTPGVRRHPDAGRCQIAGLDHVGGYEPMLLARYSELINVSAGQRPGDAMVVSSPDKPHPILEMLGARYWLLPRSLFPRPEWRRIGVLGGSEPVTVFESPRALPRAFIAGRILRLPSADERLSYLGRGPFDPAGEVVVEEDLPGLPAGGSWTPGSVRITAYRPGLYEMEAEAPSGGYLVLTEAFYPGWSARIDGAPCAIFRANHLVQGIVLPPGRHRVRFEFRSRLLPAGFLLFLAGAALPLALWLRRRRKGFGLPAGSGGL